MSTHRTIFMTNSGNNNFLDKLKPEFLFLAAGIIFGLFYVFINPPFQSNDEDRHFFRAYAIADGQISPQQGDGVIGYDIPTNLISVTQSFQGIPYFNGTKLKPGTIEKAKKVPLKKKTTTFYTHADKYNPIAFMHVVPGIFLGKYINDNPVWLHWFGRISGLFMYLIVVFIAIRITPVFKNLFLVLALTPMWLFQACSISYDTMSNALSILMAALFLYFAFAKEGKLKRNDYLLVILLTGLFPFMKNGYPLVPFLFFIVPLSKLGDMKTEKFKTISKAVLMGIFFWLSFSLPNYTWGKYLASQDLINDKYVAIHKEYKNDPKTHIKFLKENPSGFVSTVVDNILFQGEEWTAGTIGRFGYSYAKLPNAVLIIHGLVLLLTAFTDGKKNISFSTYQKAVVLFIGTGSALGIVVGTYLYMTKIGGELIFGLQGRYFLPAIPALLLFLYNSEFTLEKISKYKPVIVTAYISLILIYSIMFMSDYYYM
jgi:uncharacterized membrane protein